MDPYQKAAYSDEDLEMVKQLIEELPEESWYLKSCKPVDVVEGEMPTAIITIVPEDESDQPLVVEKK